MGQQPEQLGSILVAAIRHKGPHMPVATDETWDDLIVWASSRRLLGRSMEARGVGLLWDDPRHVEPLERRYDCAIPIDEEDVSDVSAPVMALRTMPGEYMRFEHTGPYDDLPSFYERILGVNLSVTGCTLGAAPIIEMYRNSPAEVAPEDLLCDIFVPVVRIQ